MQYTIDKQGNVLIKIDKYPNFVFNIGNINHTTLNPNFVEPYINQNNQKVEMKMLRISVQNLNNLDEVTQQNSSELNLVPTDMQYLMYPEIVSEKGNLKEIASKLPIEWLEINEKNLVMFQITDTNISENDSFEVYIGANSTFQEKMRETSKTTNEELFVIRGEKVKDVNVGSLNIMPSGNHEDLVPEITSPISSVLNSTLSKYIIPDIFKNNEPIVYGDDVDFSKKPFIKIASDFKKNETLFIGTLNDSIRFTNMAFVPSLKINNKEEFKNERKKEIIKSKLQKLIDSGVIG